MSKRLPCGCTETEICVGHVREILAKRSKPRLQYRWNGWYCIAEMGSAVWGITPKIAYEHWMVYNPRLISL